MSGVRVLNRRMNIRPEDLIQLSDAAEPLATGSAPGASGYSPSPHSLQSAHHTGQIGNTQAPQFAYEEASGTDRPAYNANRVTGALAHIVPNTTDTYDIGTSTKWFRQQFVSQINAAIFAEQVIQILGGWEIIGHDQGDFGATVGAGDTTINFGKTMTPNDFVLVKGHDTSGSIKTEYIQVGTLVSGTTYNVTRDLAAAHTTDPAWAAGVPFLVLGTTGDGRIELNAYDTPRIQMLTQGATYNAQTEVLRIGDLNAGWGYVAETYGVAMGEYGASKVNLTVDPTNGLRIRNSTTVLGQWAADGTITVGEAANSKTRIQLSGAGGVILIQRDASAVDHTVSLWDTSGGVRIGEVANGKTRMGVDPSAGFLVVQRDGAGVDHTVGAWDASGNITVGEVGASKSNVYISAGALSVRNNVVERIGLTAAGILTIKDSAGAAVFTFNASAGAEFTLPLTLATTGGIYQGTGTFASPTTGLKVWNDGGIGRIAGYNAGTLQWSATTDGILTAGAGKVVLNANGLSLADGNLQGNAVTWLKTGNITGQIFGYTSAYDARLQHNLWISSLGVEANGLAKVIVEANCLPTQKATLIVSADGNDGSAYFDFGFNSGSALYIAPTYALFPYFKVFIGGVGNTKMTTGLTINQGAADDELFAGKSFDVVHGMTDYAETDTYVLIKKHSANAGGAYIQGFTESTVGVEVRGHITTEDTTKAGGSTAHVYITGATKSGTGLAAPGANSNLLIIGRYAVGAKFIFDADGDSHQDVGTAWTNFDDFDDVALVADLAVAVSRDDDPIRRQFQEFLRYNRPVLERMRLVTFNEDGHHFVNMSKLSMLLVGAVKQLGQRLERCERLLQAA